MRLALIVLPLLAVALACNAAPKKKRKSADTTQPLERACSVKDCFVERDVRDFEVIDQTTLIVYVGSQRCAFQVEVRGTFCDLTFAPEIFFRHPNDIGRDDDRDVFSGSSPSSQLGNLRVCSHDIGVSVDGGVFTEGITQSSGAFPQSGFPDSAQSAQARDRFGNRRSECQISSVASVTDDELVQLFVDRGVAPPPPPMGAGQIEVGEQDDDAETSPPEQPAASPAGEQGATTAPEETAATSPGQD
jgi:hypothetical protein